MQTAPILEDSVTAPTRRVASGALRALGVAADLLEEAARALGPSPRSSEIQEAVAGVSARARRIDDSQRGVADGVVVAGEIARLCDEVASRNRGTSPAALGCARMAEASARLGLEALTEERGWTGTQALARRARQLGEIQDLRGRLDEMVAALRVHEVEVTPRG